MEQIRANKQITTLFEDLPLTPSGLQKKAKAEGMGTPFTLFFSFNSFVHCVKSSTKTFTSLLQDTGLDPDAKVIVRATLNMRTEILAAQNASRAK